jgi:hypothetical protein
MDKFERRRLRLIRIKDELCNGNVAELARKLEKPEGTYVHRMLYPEGKAGKKNIGDEYIELVLEKFGIDLDELSPHNVKARASAEANEEMFYQWISLEESRLITDFRTTNENGRQVILQTAGSLEKVISPAASANKG